MRFAVTKRLSQSAVFAVLPKHQNLPSSLGSFCKLPDGLLRSVRPLDWREGIASQQNWYAPPSSVHAKTRTSALTFRHCPSRVPEDACHRRLVPPGVFTNSPCHPRFPHLPNSLVRPHPVLCVSRWDVSLLSTSRGAGGLELHPELPAPPGAALHDEIDASSVSRSDFTDSKAKAEMPTNRTPATPPPEQRAGPPTAPSNTHRRALALYVDGHVVVVLENT